MVVRSLSLPFQFRQTSTRMEMMYQYLWRTGALGREFTLTDGRSVRVVSPGLHNTDAGPDFSNARIKIDGILWAGNIEIHLKASDWFRHKHHDDPAYDSIILHLVGVADKPVHRKDGSPIPTAIFPIPVEVASLYARLTSPGGDIRCGADVATLPALVKEDWLESLAMERIQEKASAILEENRNLCGDWEQTCFVRFARALGFGLNGVPFEILARSIPLKYIHRHADNPFQIEAIVFGQAGMLDSSCRIFDDRYQALCREYFFLMRKYGLRPMNQSIWKFARTRPNNFPHRRLAFLCKALEGGFSMMRALIDGASDRETIAGLFSWSLSGFWRDHFSFDTQAHRISETLSRASLDSIIINFAAPVLYAYASERGDIQLAEKAIGLLEKTDPEDNRFTRRWETIGIKAGNALRSQALIQLHKCYCDEHRCLDCRFCNRMIAKVAKESMPSYGNRTPSLWE